MDTETAAVKLVKDVNRGGYGLVATAELKQWMDNGKQMVIVDTMPYEASYKKQHIPTAVNFVFPIAEMKAIDPDIEKQYIDLLGPDKDKMIVVYCGFVKCGRSHNGAMWAVKLGYTNVHRHPGGIKAWKEAKYPVEKVK